MASPQTQPTNETEVSRQQREQHQGIDRSVKAFALLHLVCCAGPLLVYALYALGAVALGSLIANSALFLGIAGAVLSAIALTYYFKRGCATCPRLIQKVEAKHQGGPDRRQEVVARGTG